MAKGAKPESIKKVELGVVNKATGNVDELKEVRWRETGKSMKYYVGNSQPTPKLDMPHPAKVISRLNHQVILCYDGEGMVLPPNGRKIVPDLNKLGTLPRGITVVPIVTKK
jgi:hypothetical protein